MALKQDLDVSVNGCLNNYVRESGFSQGMQVDFQLLKERRLPFWDILQKGNHRWPCEMPKPTYC